jgi:hypothetical protein
MRISARPRARCGRKHGDRPERRRGEISNASHCGGLATRMANGCGVMLGGETSFGKPGARIESENLGRCRQDLIAGHRASAIRPGAGRRTRAPDSRVRGAARASAASRTRAGGSSRRTRVEDAVNTLPNTLRSLRCASPVELNADFPLVRRKIRVLACVASLILLSVMLPSKNCGSSLSKGR